MGKIRTRIIGLEDVEKEQKKEQKKRAVEKKTLKVEAKEVPAEKEVVEEKPSSAKASEVKQKKSAKKVTTRKRGKKYTAAKMMTEKDKQYALKDAIALLKKMKYAGFDESVELHINTTVEGLRGEVSLPHATGKTVRVAVVDDALLDQIEEGKIEFDVLVSHPSFMPKLAKYAKILGPRGLMPNPKTGTLSPKPEEVAKKFQAGTLRWKGEAKSPLLHQMVAKLSADDKAIAENVEVFIASVGRDKIKEVFIKSTMSPALQISF